jgi:hypothetical protein
MRAFIARLDIFRIPLGLLAILALLASSLGLRSHGTDASCYDLAGHSSSSALIQSGSTEVPDPESPSGHEGSQHESAQDCEPEPSFAPLRIASSLPPLQLSRTAFAPRTLGSGILRLSSLQRPPEASFSAA